MANTMESPHTPFRGIQPLIPPSYKYFPRHLPRPQQVTSVYFDWDIPLLPTLVFSRNLFPQLVPLLALITPQFATSS